MSRTAQRALLGSCAGLLVALVLALALSRDRGVPRIDFKQVVPSDESTPLRDNRPVLRVAIGAMISPGVTEHYYQEIFRVLGNKVGRQTALVQRKTYAEVNDLVRSRAVDLAFVCSGPYVLGHEEFGMEIVAIPVVDGAKVYYSYILANAQAGVESFAALRGKRFAFTDPDSNTGCLVPRFMLSRLRETPQSYFRETFFTHSHDNSIKAVADGMADGAAVDSLIWEFLKATAPATVSRTVVIHKSPPYGIPPLVVHPALDPGLKAKLKEVLLALHQDPVARRLLQSIRIEGFAEGSDQLYASVREMQAWLAANP